MDDDYHFDKGKNYARLRNMVVFAAAVSAVVFTIVGLIFIVDEYVSVSHLIYPPAGGNGTGNESGGTCDDSCLIGLALANSNSSYCRNVSASRSDECWAVFSSGDFNACKELRNYTLGKKCIGDFAFSEKNASLCDLLQGSDVQVCKDKISPPCMDIAGQAEKELCLALRNHDASYCSDAGCFLAYAKASNDTSACAKLDNEAEKAACEGVVNNIDTCRNWTGIYTADYCYQLFAQYSGNYGFCGNIATGLYQYNCFLSEAQAENDSSSCARVALEYRWDCYKAYALSAGDLGACLAIDPLAENSRDGCVYDYAGKFADPAACANLSNVYMRTQCYANVILPAKGLTLDKCGAVPHPDWKDKCYSRLAVQDNDKADCYYIKSTDETSLCLSNFP